VKKIVGRSLARCVKDASNSFGLTSARQYAVLYTTCFYARILVNILDTSTILSDGAILIDLKDVCPKLAYVSSGTLNAALCLQFSSAADGQVVIITDISSVVTKIYRVA